MTTKTGADEDPDDKQQRDDKKADAETTMDVDGEDKATTAVVVETKTDEAAAAGNKDKDGDDQDKKDPATPMDDDAADGDKKPATVVKKEKTKDDFTMISLVSDGGAEKKTFQLSLAAAKHSGLVRQALEYREEEEDEEDDDEAEKKAKAAPIHCLRVQADCLEKVVEFLKHHHDVEPMKEINLPFWQNSLEEVRVNSSWFLFSLALFCTIFSAHRKERKRRRNCSSFYFRKNSPVTQYARLVCFLLFLLFYIHSRS